MRARRSNHRLAAAAALALALAAPDTARALQQPDGTTIPSAPGCNANKPTGLSALFSCVCTTPNICNIGASCPGGSAMCDPGTNGMCETTMWHSPNDNSCIPSNVSGLDVIKEAATTPETYHPTCPLTFGILSRGTAVFENAFGWYNVVPGAAPAASDLHVMIDCHAQPGAQVVLDVKSEPAYKGGDVGFFLVTPEDHTQKGKCAGGDCCATVARATTGGAGWIFYSERHYNPDAMNVSNPFIHLIVYGSHLVPRKFYLAWEDTFGGSSGDFTDLVTSVEGVECSGAGATCTTSNKGICALGVTHCTSGTLACQQLYQSTTEVCNGLDDDCDGAIDNGATCGGGLVCWNGACVPHCQQSEFPCANNDQCDAVSGLCIDPSCTGVTCPAEQICKKGTCGAACDGITCPHGEVCRLGNCLDPCAAVTCTSGMVCSQGFCVPGCASCDGLQCASPLGCDAKSGQCVDPSCANACPQGTWCNKGACVDACLGAVCPQGFACSGGRCLAPGQSAGDGGAPASADLGVGGSGRAGVGCGCAVGTRASNREILTLLIGIHLLLRIRRRRSALRQ